MLYIRSVSCLSINPFKVSYFLSFSAFLQYYVTVTLRLKCPNKEFSLVRIFPYSKLRKIWTRKTLLVVVLFRSVSFVNNSLYINHIQSLVPSALLSLLGYYYWFIDFLFRLNFLSFGENFTPPNLILSYFPVSVLAISST